ncbi:MAG TPA: hypothetical protein VHJ82_01755 [Actinomycetota bacterium]|nr:hypothetical protein [Actinomycetota bacterium]
MRRLLTGLIAGCLIAASCGGTTGGDSAAPEDLKAQLTSAIQSLGQQDGLTLTLSLQSTPESLAALAAEDGGQLAPEDAEKILSSSITLSVRQGDTPQDSEFALALNAAGTSNAFEMRVVNDNLYVRADVASFLELVGQDPAAAQALAQQAAASGMDFAVPAVEGRWLTIQGLTKLSQQFTGGMAPPTPSEIQQQAIDEFTQAIEASATVTEAGEDEAGQHTVVTLPLRDLFQRFVQLAQSLGPLPGPLPAASEVPDEQLRLDAWVSDDRLTQVELDFLQFAAYEDEEVPEGVDRFALRMGIDEFAGGVEEPTDAVPIDLQKLMGAFFGGLMGSQLPAAGGGGGGGGSDAEFCDFLKGEPRYVKKQFKEECPGLLN